MTTATNETVWKFDVMQYTVDYRGHTDHSGYQFNRKVAKSNNQGTLMPI